MPNSQAFEFLVEACGATLTMADVNLAGAPSGIEGCCLLSGESKCLRIGEGADLGATGSLSLYAGGEKIGTLNWDQVDLAGDNPVDWTPLSKNFTTSVLNGMRNGQAKMRVGRCYVSDKSKMSVSTGQLGFAGI